MPGAAAAPPLAAYCGADLALRPVHARLERVMGSWTGLGGGVFGNADRDVGAGPAG